ncbi:hypothetical protein [Obesumbacterium proteus]|uniref:hypothetical protein n=1 Tax=Obesumbacterium proteus TaxID=82983 RepID=UPI000778AFD8|nr:hypothetical protein [Obesumbacterium proteus]AMO83876.1 hypothetical protein DSM2777_10990 [Obesumbacterium proteus]
MKKFELVAELSKEFFGRKLFRIRALISFSDISKGDLGGWVEKEECVDQSGNAWVYGDAQVYGNAWVYGDALVSGNALVYGNARVCGNAWVSGDAWVSGNARVCGNAWVSGNAQVYGNARVSGNAQVSGDAQVYDNAHHITVSPIGSEGGFLTAFRQKDNSIVVRRGCFSGSIEEFEKAINATHGDSKYAEQYKIVIALIKSRLESVEQNND